MRLAVIPARGGSKRIPRKNIKPFAGKPMIVRSIAAAQESGCFDQVVVSTDDDEIADIARAAGADVPFMRPRELSDDHAGTAPVIAHATRWALDSGFEVSYVCCVYATAPFIRPGDLQKAMQLLEETAADYIFTMTTFPFPIQRALRQRDDGGIEMFYPEHASTRSQDLDEAFHDAGQFYCGRAEAWLQARPIFSASSRGMVLPRFRVQDIDTEEDWIRAELMLQAIDQMEKNRI